jgi:hypothetical protein
MNHLSHYHFFYFALYSSTLVWRDCPLCRWSITFCIDCQNDLWYSKLLTRSPSKRKISDRSTCPYHLNVLLLDAMFSFCSGFKSITAMGVWSSAIQWAVDAPQTIQKYALNLCCVRYFWVITPLHWWYLRFKFIYFVFCAEL